MNEYLQNLQFLQSGKQEPTNLRTIEIVKSYMKEMVGSYKDEMLKERQNEQEARLEIEVEKIKQLLGKPKKL